MRSPISRLLLGAVLMAPSLASAQNMAVRVFYVHTDQRGSPLAATDESGAVLWRESYTPQGGRRLRSPASADQVAWFAGHVEDRQTGLIYMGARYYDPVLGVFLSLDPAEIKPEQTQTFARFAYANHNPYRYVDPDGRESQEIERSAMILWGRPVIGHESVTHWSVSIPVHGDDNSVKGWKTFEVTGSEGEDGVEISDGLPTNKTSATLFMSTPNHDRDALRTAQDIDAAFRKGQFSYADLPQLFGLIPGPWESCVSGAIHVLLAPPSSAPLAPFAFP